MDVAAGKSDGFRQRGAARPPNARFLVSPFADRVLRHIMGAAERSHPAVSRGLARELRLVLDRYPEIPKKSGKTGFAQGDVDGIA